MVHTSEWKCKTCGFKGYAERAIDLHHAKEHTLIRCKVCKYESHSNMEMCNHNKDKHTIRTELTIDKVRK